MRNNVNNFESSHTAADGSKMGKRGAVGHNSGEPVDHSGPGLGRPTTPATAGRKPAACPPPIFFSPAQPKSGQGSGDGVPGGGVAAERVPTLDPIQINRNRLLGRGKHCGRYTVRGETPGSAETRFYSVRCKSWGCPYCGPRRAKRYKHAIRATAEARQLQRFLTLTLDPKKIEGDPVRYLNAAFAKLRIYLQREFGVSPQYIRILEFQKNGNPHFHILIDRYIDLEWIRRAWVAVGGGFMVDIRLVDVHRVSRYLSKYLTKELLMSAPLRCRRVTTSRGIKLLEKTPTETVWTLVKVTISRLLDVYGRAVNAVWLDDDQMLESFTVILND